MSQENVTDPHSLRLEFPRTGPDLNKRRPMLKASTKYRIAAIAAVGLVVAFGATFLYAIFQ